MIDALCALIDDAVRAGFNGLCATGDMRWELGADENFDRLLEYEARLDQVFRDKPLRGICQYHRALVPAKAVRDALLTHQSAYIGDAFNRDNLFYVPPELLLDDGDTAATATAGEWMCQQILRVLDAERVRDEALADLRQSAAHERALARELAEMNRDLERRVAERTAELTAANQSLESFSYSVSHDLRAPLRAISGFSEILAEKHAGALGPDGRRQLDRVRAGARHMEELIDGMLTLARVAKTELVRTSVDLSAVAEEVVRELRESAPARAMDVVIQPGLRAVGDRVLLRAVLHNLLENAWKFTAQQAAPRIDVGAAWAAAGDATFFVRDNGAGFDKAYADRLFGVFQRLHAQNEFAGTGVGLATVQRIVTRHGGRVWAEAEVGRGATFFFTLPRQG
jgi:signal transduction histidine kinase